HRGWLALVFFDSARNKRECGEEVCDAHLRGECHADRFRILDPQSMGRGVADWPCCGGTSRLLRKFIYPEFGHLSSTGGRIGGWFRRYGRRYRRNVNGDNRRPCAAMDRQLHGPVSHRRRGVLGCTRNYSCPYSEP